MGYKYKKIEGGIAKVFITNRITGETVPSEEFSLNPYALFSIEQLQEVMKSAIAKEDYEDAAVIKKYIDYKIQEDAS